MIRMLLVCIVAISTPVLAQSVQTPDIPYQKFVLANGLTLIVHEDHKAPIAAVNVWYHVGSKNERRGKTGFAHLFEHLMFNGSENFNDDYFKAVERVGATDLNGTTNEDRTNYFQNVPVSALDTILWLESDRMGHLLGAVTQAKLDEQRGVVQNEKRQGENQPYGKVWDAIVENTFPANHPYSWSPIGSMEDLNAASLDDVKEWFRNYYGAANATLVIAGDVNAADIKQRVEKYFGNIPPGPPVTAQKVWVPKLQGEHRQVMQDRVPQARVHKVWNVPEYGHPDLTYLQLAMDILAKGKSSRLYGRLVYRERTASDVQAYVDSREIASQILLMASAQPGGDLRAVERALNEEVRAFLTNGPTAAELARVKTQVRSDFVRGIERIGGFGGKSDILARSQVFTGNPEAYKTEMTRIANATPAQVLAAAKKWLTDGSYVLEVHPYPNFAASNVKVDRSKPPEAGSPPPAPLPPAQRATLSNGLNVVLVQRPTLPIVRVSAFLDGGFAADAPQKPGVASLTMQMLDEGTTSRTAPQLADRLAELGAILQTGASLDSLRVSLNVLRDQLDAALPLYADVILNPNFPAGDLQRVKQITLAGIQQEKVDPMSLGLRVLPGLLYGAQHAYGQPLTGSGTEASLRAITREDLVAFHRAWFKPNHTTVVAVGDITLAELTAKLERAFAGWQRGTVPTKNVPAVGNKPTRTVYLLDRPGAEQSVILAGQLVPSKSSPDELAFELFNDSFGGTFVSRLNMNLREDKHWSYGASSFVVDARGERLWMLAAPVQTDKTKESLQEAMRELGEAVGSRPLTRAELDAAQDRSIKTLAGRWETGSSVVSALGEIAVFGLPHDYYATLSERIRNSTEAQVNAAARRYLNPSQLVWVIVGDRAKIESGLRDLKLGEIVLLDADGKPTN